MNPDDELCLCFHVSRRKVEQYIRIHRPTHASQLADCYGAGTGCGWCRPFLRRLLEQSTPEELELPDPKAYQSGRSEYRTKQS
jgi:NAD(P)H-nitrite reductase large subunit